MIVNGKTYNITLTEKEVQTITDALQGYYKSRIAIVNDKTQSDFIRTKTQEMIPGIKDLRNNFGRLVNVSFMGADA